MHTVQALLHYETLPDCAAKSPGFLVQLQATEVVQRSGRAAEASTLSTNLGSGAVAALIQPRQPDAHGGECRCRHCGSQQESLPPCSVGLLHGLAAICAPPGATGAFQAGPCSSCVACFPLVIFRPHTVCGLPPNTDTARKVRTSHGSMSAGRLAMKLMLATQATPCLWHSASCGDNHRA